MGTGFREDMLSATSTMVTTASNQDMGTALRAKVFQDCYRDPSSDLNPMAPQDCNYIMYEFEPISQRYEKKFILKLGGPLRK